MPKHVLIFFLSFSFLFSASQNIGGVINSYASVSGIAGSAITVNSSTGFFPGDRILLIQMKGASVISTNNNTFGNITGMGGAGTHEFLDILSTTATGIVTTSAPLNTYNTTAFVQVVRVPKYCQATVTSTLTCLPWSPDTARGGVIALEAGTLTLNSDINANEKGFLGGNFANSNFCCSNGNFAGPAGVNGGQKGESISAYLANQDGMKGKQANGGGGSNCGNSGGGGGGNGGTGGNGGDQYSGCGTFNDRGQGGLLVTSSPAALFLGGGGGGGFRDNGQPCSDGGNGGGIIFIRANTIICNNRVIAANGGSVGLINDEGSGGGGAGGSVFIVCTNYVGNLAVMVNGGSGGSNNNVIFTSDCHGPGGGGAGGVFHWSTGANITAVTFFGNGGAAGTVNNPSSACFNTTSGATAGTNGISSSGLGGNLLSYTTPTINVVQSNTVCAGQTTTLTANGAVSYQWISGPATASASFTPSAATAYTVIGSNGSCTASAVHTVNVSGGPTITAAGTQSICAGQQASMTVSGATNYTWSTGNNATLVFVTPSITTVYSVTGSNFGCAGQTTHTVNVATNHVLSITGNTALCQGQSATLTAATANSYSWSNSVSLASQIVTPQTTTSYQVTGFNGVCSSSAAITISVSPSPTVSITSDKNFLCAGQSANLNVTGIGAASYLWLPADGIPNNSAQSVIVRPDVSTSYSLFAFAGNNNCYTMVTTSITVLTTPQTFVKTDAEYICINSFTKLYAWGADAFSWSPPTGLSSASQATINASPVTTQHYTVTGTNGVFPNSCSSTATITVNVLPFSVINFIAPDSVCYGHPTRIYAIGAKSYTWEPPLFLSNHLVENPIITPTTAIQYTVTGIIPGKCAASSELHINIKPMPFANAGRDTSLNFDQSVVLNGSGNGDVYTWEADDMGSINCINCPTTMVSPVKNTWYTLEVESAQGCAAYDRVLVTIRDESALYVPNSFTPNGDGVNDLFMPMGFGVRKYDLYVFDRWGEKLFYGSGSFTDQQIVSWDGKFKGQTCKTDTYIYKIIYVLHGSKTLVKEGPVLLLDN